jgi:hypothetical protein
MSFKDFVASHTGRYFFEQFGSFTKSIAGLVEEIAKLRALLEMQCASQQRTELAEEMPIIPVPEAMPCIVCNEVVPTGASIAMLYRGVPALLCKTCAEKKGLIIDVPTN